MGLWAGIKYALNSTLGTENFKPLDKKIIEQMRMLPSDEIYYSFSPVNSQYELPPDGEIVEEVLPYSFKMTRYGAARFKGVLKLGSYRVSTVTFAIYKNGVKVYELSRNNDFQASTFEFPFSIDINFNPYDVFEFKLIGNCTHNMGDYMSMNDFSLCGTIEHNFFEFI